MRNVLTGVTLYVICLVVFITVFLTLSENKKGKSPKPVDTNKSTGKHSNSELTDKNKSTSKHSNAELKDKNKSTGKHSNAELTDKNKPVAIHPNFIVIPDNKVSIESNLGKYISSPNVSFNDMREEGNKFKHVISYRNDYFVQIAAEHNIKTLLFQTTDSDKDDHVVYQWIGSKSLCTALVNYKGRLRFSKSCTPNMTQTLVAQRRGAERKQFRLPVNNTLTKKLFQWGTISSFIHIIYNGIISMNGVVFVGGLMVVPCSCLDRPRRVQYARNNFDLYIKNKTLPHYGEVFVISQLWSQGFFHGMVEALPRLSRYIGFIDQRKDIKIFVVCTPSIKSSLQALFPSKNISELIICEKIGPIIAKKVYFPEGSPCFRSTHSGVSQISKEFKRVITPGIPIPPKNYIILIKRTRNRFLVQHKEIASFLADIAEQNDMDLLIFSDGKLPSFNDTRKIFHQAKLVVAPHGAGLANTIYSNPGLFVIEIVCNRPHLNLCFRELAIFLGHHYHGVYAKSGCPAKLNVDVNEVKEAVGFYIKHVAALKIH